MKKEAMRFTKDQVRELKRIALEKKLKGADVLNEFSDDQMVESFNGVGNSTTPEWQKWILTKILEKRLPAILIHDMAYRKGGSSNDFKRVNKELGENIAAMDREKNPSWYDFSNTWWDFAGRKAREYTDREGRAGWGKP